jgi:hypothetical protein
MDTFAEVSAPPWARKMWCDNRFIYMEMPVVDHPPITLKWSFAEGGLSQALKMMRQVEQAAAPLRKQNGHYQTGDHPVIKRSRSKPKLEQSPESRSIAWKVLKKLGMI